MSGISRPGLKTAQLVLLIICFLQSVAGFTRSSIAETKQSIFGNRLSQVESIEIVSLSRETKVILGLNRPVAFSTFVMGDPDRLVIDFEGVALNLNGETSFPVTSAISDFRFGRLSAQKTRIVFDLKGKSRIARAILKQNDETNTASIIILLNDTRLPVNSDVRHVGENGKSITKRKIEKGVARVVSVTNKPVVVIDPGHGGIDPGAIGANGKKEKDIVLQFALALKKDLEKNDRIVVKMTRDNDEFIKLSERVAIARSHRAALMISIHADSVPQSYVRGATVYSLSDEASDSVGAELERQESRSEILAGFDVEQNNDIVGDILIDLARRETEAHSRIFSNLLVSQMKKKIRMSKNATRSADLMVLRAPDVPSVLIELGYLSNRDDEKALQSVAWRQNAVKAIVDTINRHVSGF